jgi:hypothetical protein
LSTSACTKAKLVYPLVASRAQLAIFYFPWMLAVELEMSIYLRRDSFIGVMPFTV